MSKFIPQKSLVKEEMRQRSMKFQETKHEEHVEVQGVWVPKSMAEKLFKELDEIKKLKDQL